MSKPLKNRVISVTVALSIACAAHGQTRQIDVDAANSVGRTSDVFRFSIGGDRAIIHLRPSDQRDLKRVHDECGFKYIRFHSLLNEEMKVVAAGETYDWSKIDAVYDFVLSIGMKPFVELGFMPEPLASGTQTIFYYNGNTTPPKSFEAWGKLVTSLARHLTDRYGANEVKQWYFEVWNEPNLDMFWHATQADYFHLYDVSSRAIKAVNSSYRVGGPATAGIGLAWVPEFLAASRESGSPIDFISTHLYGVTAGALDEKGNAQLMLDPSPNAIVGALPKLLDTIHASDNSNLPLFITEWSASYSARDAVHDSYISAPYILSKLRRIPAGVGGMSYWTFSDQFEENGPVPSPFHGGFGLLNAQGLPKPAFFAYKFLNALGPTELACNDADSWATRNDAGDVQVLFWNFTTPKQDRPDSAFFARDLPSTPASPVTVRVRNVTPGDYDVRTYRIGYRHNDVLTRFVDLGKPVGVANDPGLLPEAVFQKLAQSCDGAPTSTARVHIDSDRSWASELPMNQNDVYFLTMHKTGQK